MNTRLDIILWGVPAEHAAHISQEIIVAGRDMEQVLNRHDSKSETSLVNHQALHREVHVSSHMMRAIINGIHYYQKTGGLFNIFSGNAFDAVKKGLNAKNTLSAEDPAETVITNEERQTVRFTTKNASLDFGGLGKGMALDEAAEILASYPAINAFISFGGSSVLTRGHHPHGEFWPFSFREVGITETWHLTNDALSISQTKTENKEHTHILNTLEEKTVTGNRMACVQSNSATDGEVLSTALLAGPENMQNKIVAAFDIKKHRIYNIMP